MGIEHTDDTPVWFSLSQIERAADRLRVRCESGSLGQLEMGIEMAAYRFRDSQSRYWYLDPYRQQWYVYTESEWQTTSQPMEALQAASVFLSFMRPENSLSVNSDPGFPGIDVPPTIAAHPEPAIDEPESAALPIPAWELLITHGPDKDRRCVLEDRIRIGREADNEVCLPRREISRHHAMLERAGDQIQLVDMGSINGTYVNGERITDHVILNSGDTFSIHDSQFMVLQGGASPPAPKVETTCPRCGATVHAGRKFCTQCGSRVS